jgi:hypothetical protein
MKTLTTQKDLNRDPERKKALRIEASIAMISHMLLFKFLSLKLLTR